MKKKPTQEDYVRRTTRFPPETFAELERAAKENGRSFNAEVIARLDIDQFAALRREVAELKAMIREVLDRS